MSAKAELQGLVHYGGADGGRGGPGPQDDRRPPQGADDVTSEHRHVHHLVIVSVGAGRG